MMKKILKYGFIAVVMILSALSAKADVTFYVYVDNPDLVTVRVQYDEREVVKGMNKYTCFDYSSVNFNIKGNAYFKSITENGVEQLTAPTSYFGRYMTESDNNNAVYTVTTITYEEICTASFNMTVDNPARLANMSVNGTPSFNYNSKSFEADVARKIIFNPDGGTRVTYNASGAPFYRVTVNGEDVEPDSYGNFGFVPSDGDNVMIYADYPDEMSKVTFDFSGDAASLIDEVFIYGDASTGYSRTPVEFTSEGFEVKRGSQVVLQHVPSFRDYNVKSYTAGNRTFSSSETAQFYVTGDMTVAIDAELSTALTVTVDIDDASSMQVQRGSYSKDFVDLTDGSNTVGMHATNSELLLRKMPGYNVVSLTRNGNPVDVSWDGKSYTTAVADGDRIEVRTEAIEPFKCYITVDDPSRVVLKRYYNTTLREQIVPLTAGRNEITMTDECEEAKTLHLFAADGCYINYARVNGEDLERDNWSGYFKIEGGADYEVTMESEVIDRSERYVLWVDDMAAPNLSSVSWSSVAGTKIDNSIASGYNVKDFFHGDNYFKISAYYDYGTEKTCALFINGEQIECEGYGTSAESKMNLADGDVVKLFLATGSPESYKIRFTTTDSENPKVSGDVRFADVLRDVISVVDDPSQEATVLQGTRYDFTVDASDATEKVDYTVTVNGVVATPDADGVYSVVIDADTEVNLAYEMVPYAELYLVGDFNGWGVSHRLDTDNGDDYMIELERLEGQFKIVDGEWNDYVFGGDGSAVELDVPKVLVNGSNSNLTIADGGASDLSVRFNLGSSTLTVSGTALIGAIGVDQYMDSPETYYTLQGVRINGRPLPGVYIRVAGGMAEKVIVEQ